MHYIHKKLSGIIHLDTKLPSLKNQTITTLAIDIKGVSEPQYIYNYKLKSATCSCFSTNTIAEYLWIDVSGLGTRSKTKTIDNKVDSLADLPNWIYDGSSTYQALTHNSEVIMKPVAYYPDPFRGGDNVIVMTETFYVTDKAYKELQPANTNFRQFTRGFFEAVAKEEPWFGIKQEYSLLEKQNKFTLKPLGRPDNGFP